ncbi:dihydropteroate synthase [Frigoribacterium sp. CFBP 13712]|uniref:dihydropteroate synthase n=1 Tax=Frigoribacterium sp. CFBP 13712 TaxID=2775309 RepID=UPI00352C73C8
MTDSPSRAHRASDETSAGRVWKRPRGRARYPDPVVLDAPPASAPAAGSERRLVLSLGERAAVRPPAQLPPVTQTPATRTPGGPSTVTPGSAPTGSASPSAATGTPGGPSTVSEPALPTRASGRRLIAGGRFDGPLDDRDEASTRTRVGSHAAPSPVVPPVRGADELRRPPASSSPGVEPDAATLVMDIVQPAATSAETAAATSAAPAAAATATATAAAAPAPRPPRGGPLVVGIVNVTPDSFSDGGRYVEVDDALRHARALVEAGADVIDVGGESTRPGSARVAPIDEQRRVLPVIRQLASEGVRVSIDTMNAATAYAAVEVGADIVNDVSGGLADRFMAQAVADTGSTFVAMHWRGPLDGSDRPDYRDVVTDVHDELQQRVADLVAQGIDPSRLVLDPGLGFSKDAAQNWQVLAGLRGLGRLGLPLMVGASRKRFLGELLPEGAPIEARDQATAVVSVLAALEGVWAVRVHDVAATRAALDVWQAWQQGGRSAGAAKSTRSARHA